MITMHKRHGHLALLISCFAAIGGVTQAEARIASPLQGTGISLQCVNDTEARFGIHRSVMMAIYAVEGGKNGLVSPNRNGSNDLGNFQINDNVWLSMFERKFKVSRSDILNKPCINYQAANYILWQYLQQQKSSKSDTWWKICKYHSGTFKYRKIYCDKLKKKWYSLKKYYPEVMQITRKAPPPPPKPSRRPIATGGVYKNGKMVNMGSYSQLFVSNGK